MANEKNITTVRDEDKSFIRVIMSLPPEKKNLIQGNYYRPGSARETDRNGGQIGRQHFDI